MPFCLSKLFNRSTKKQHSLNINETLPHSNILYSFVKYLESTENKYTCVSISKNHQLNDIENVKTINFVHHFYPNNNNIIHWNFHLTLDSYLNSKAPSSKYFFYIDLEGGHQIPNSCSEFEELIIAYMRRTVEEHKTNNNCSEIVTIKLTLSLIYINN